MGLITIPGASALTTLPKLNITQLTSTITDVPKVPKFNFDKQSLNDLSKIKQTSLKKNANYLDGIKSQQDNLKKQLTTDVAAKQKALVPTAPKLEVAIPSVPGAGGLPIPKAFTCTPNFDEVIAAIGKAIDTVKSYIPPIPSPSFNLPKLPKIPKFPSIDDYWKMIPAKCRDKLKATHPNPTIPELILLMNSCKDLLPSIPTTPPIPGLEALKTFCKPPVEAPAANVLLPKVKTETVTESKLDSTGNFVQTTTFVSKVEAPMDKAKINDTAQVKILGEARRQQIVNDFIIHTQEFLNLLPQLQGYIDDEIAFQAKYSDVTNHPFTSTEWADVLSEYQTIHFNLKKKYTEINLFFYKEFKAILEQNSGNEEAVAMVKLFDLAETEAAKDSKFDYIKSKPFITADYYGELYAPSHLKSFASTLKTKYNNIVQFAFKGDFGENSSIWAPFGLTYFDLNLEFYQKYFDDCKCEVWKNAGGENAFDVLSRKKYNNCIDQFATDMIIKEGIFSNDYAPTKILDPYAKYNFKKVKKDFSSKWIEVQIKILMQELQKSLPPQG
mgnify:FL=1